MNDIPIGVRFSVNGGRDHCSTAASVCKCCWDVGVVVVVILKGEDLLCRSEQAACVFVWLSVLHADYGHCLACE